MSDWIDAPAFVWCWHKPKSFFGRFSSAYWRGGGASQWYEVFTINCVFQHIPQLKTEQSAQGEKCWKIRFSGCCWIKGEMHDRWEGLAPSPLLVGHIPAEQISDTQPFKKKVLDCLKVLSEMCRLRIQRADLKCYLHLRDVRKMNAEVKQVKLVM